MAGAVHVSVTAWRQMDLPDELAINRTVELKGKAVPMETMLLNSQSATAAEVRGLLLLRWPKAVTPRGPAHLPTIKSTAKFSESATAL